ncbi:MAG: EAL domain-containing protein [Pseudomonadota bacterium]|nr:EAL domain-containing protein [Pseudomonadota bacterium]
MIGFMETGHDIAVWRARIFASLLPSVLIVGGLSTVVVTPLLLHHGLWQVCIADVLAMSWTFAIWRLDRLAYHTRVGQFIAIVFLLAIVLMLSVGSISLSYLLGPPLIAAILMGLRPAMLALALGAASLFFFGAAGMIDLTVRGWDDPVKVSLVAAVNYATVGAMLSLACSKLLKGLSQSLTDLQTSATTLETASASIHQLAFYDMLTGLPNRRRLMDRLDALVAPDRADRTLGAVLYLDLDKFKDVNDARGHAIGDALLGHAAARLSAAIGPGDMVARIGGDEFVVLLEELDAHPDTAAELALAMAVTVRAALAVPLDLEGQVYHTRASIGVVVALPGGSSAHDLLREADVAMYHAKSSGRDGVALFAGAMLADTQDKLMLERDLAQAMTNGELAMHLQLQVDHAGVPAGAELLMRWRRADGTMVAPDKFIPVAETSGLIVPLGHWVLREACAAWLVLAQAGHAMPLSINVSPLQFRQPDFVEQVEAVLAATGVPPQQLIFEVTEGLLIEDIDQALSRMNTLATLGIRFSIDDFGTGYSNLAYLTKMPLYELKIDKSFMHATPHDAGGTAIVQSILSMASHLGLRVVAEGIELQEQAHYLAAHGRPFMQGYLFHRPMPLAQVIAHLGRARSSPASI